MRRFAKYLAIFLAIILVIFVIALIVASYLFDQKIDSAVRVINSKQNSFVLDYHQSSSSLFEKKGRANIKVKKTPLGEFILPLDVDTTFGLDKVNIHFANVPGEGSIDDITRALNLPNINFLGDINFYPWELKAEGKVKTNALTINLEDGNCIVGENLIKLSGRSLNSIEIETKSAGLKCRSFTKYNELDAYNVELLNPSIVLRPNLDLKKKQVSLEKFSIGFDSLNLDASTLYLIGFKPDDRVKDPTLRDSFKLDNFKLNLKIDDVDKRQRLLSDGKMSINFAFPHIKEGQEVPYYDLKDLVYDVEVRDFNLTKILTALKKHDDTLVPSILSAFTSPIVLKLNKFNFTHQGGKVDLNGFTKLTLDQDTLRPTSIDALLKAKAHHVFVDEFVNSQYQQGLDDYLKSGAIKRNGDSYETILSVHDKDVSLNDISINSSLEDDEEPRVIKDLK